MIRDFMDRRPLRSGTTWFQQKMVRCEIAFQKFGESLCDGIRTTKSVLTCDLTTKNHSLLQPHDPLPTGVGGP